MSNHTLTSAEADAIVEDLRSGLPPRRFASHYSVGHDRFLQGVRRRLLDAPSDRGRIRFVSGSWGSGKTHFLRLLQETAFDAGFLVAPVELSSDQAPFNRFELVFSEIVRSITSPSMYARNEGAIAAPFGRVLEEALFADRDGDGESIHVVLDLKRDALMAATEIDIDVRRLVAAYWDTFGAETEDTGALEERRGLLLQWFAGEGHATTFRKEFGLQKAVKRENARLVLSSLVALIRHLGFQGLVVLFDEAETTHSTMRKSNLRQAHNNLLALINGIEETNGALLIYASVPEFFTDERTGIKVYGALAQRIGQPKDAPPRAVDRVWNIDEIAHGEADFTQAACRIRDIYVTALPDLADELSDDDKLTTFVEGLVKEHPRYGQISVWRVVVQGVIRWLDDVSEGGDEPAPKQVHRDVMELIRGD